MKHSTEKMKNETLIEGLNNFTAGFSSRRDTRVSGVSDARGINRSPMHCHFDFDLNGCDRRGVIRGHTI